MKIQNITTSFIGVCAVLFLGFIFATMPLTSEAKSGNHASSTATSTKGIGKNLDATCMASAVSAREETLMDAWSDMSSSTLAALMVRKTALNSAWVLTTVKERSLAVSKAWKAWRSDKKEITADFRSERKGAWETFKKTAKNDCKMTTPKDEALEKSTSDTIAI